MLQVDVRFRSLGGVFRLPQPGDVLLAAGVEASIHADREALRGDPLRAT